MTHIITGPAGSGKTAALYELLKNDSKSRILLVPDQFVFESERRVAKETDEKTSDIKVMGFMSLSESILKKHCPSENLCGYYGKDSHNERRCQRAVRRS